MAATPAWIASIEAMLNRSLAGSAQAAERLRELSGSSILIDVEGLARIAVAATPGGLHLLAGGEERPDATIAGPPFALWQLMQGAATPGARPSAAARISGDAQIANSYRRLLTLARPDLEEELARHVGDFPARQISRFAREARGFLARLGGTARANVAEYLIEEGRDLINRTELEEFLRGVDEVREAADRLEARLRRLETRLEGHH